jgi:chorismate dehydratase
MSKLRISVVDFLNAAPLAWGLTEGPLAGRYDLSFRTPSACAEALRNGGADAAIIPAIEYQRIDNLAVLPGMAVAAKGEVRSILLVAKKPIRQVERIALDASSRSSAALVRLLCRLFWKIQPEFIEMRPDAPAMLAATDAALIIGDPALRLAIRMAELAERQPTGEHCCQGDPKDMPVPGFDTLFVHDVTFQWREMTGHPCVLAIWAGRYDSVSPELIADLKESCRYGIERLADIADAASLKLDLPVAELEKYLRVNLNFTLDAENLAGLGYYYEECAAAGLIPQARPLQLGFAAAARTAHQE